jgi:hypothetical protein
MGKKSSGSYWKNFTGFWQDPDDPRTKINRVTEEKTSRENQTSENPTKISKEDPIMTMRKEDMSESLKRQAPKKKWQTKKKNRPKVKRKRKSRG